MTINRRRTNTLLIFAATFLFTSVLSGRTVFAASTTMNITPQTGSYGASFPVSLVIDGHGDAFNAAQAKVNVSDNLKVSDLVLGDCNLAFVKTPSVADPSFESVILGGSSKKCTVYTLTLSPTVKGNATISLSQATVKRYGDAAEVLSSYQGGSYTITAVASTKTKAAHAQETPIPTPANGLYTVVIKVLSAENAPVNNDTVTLATVAGGTPLTATTDMKGTVQFPNIKSGVYSVTVAKQKSEPAKNIVNVTGPNHVLTLGINLKAQQNNPLLKPQTGQNNFFLIVGILVMGILVGVILALLPRWLKRSKKATVQTSSQPYRRI